MTGRVTRSPDPDELPSLRDRNPGMYWVAVILVVALVLSTAAGLVAAFLA